MIFSDFFGVGGVWPPSPFSAHARETWKYFSFDIPSLETQTVKVSYLKYFLKILERSLSLTKILGSVRTFMNCDVLESLVWQHSF